MVFNTDMLGVRGTLVITHHHQHTRDKVKLLEVTRGARCILTARLSAARTAAQHSTVALQHSTACRTAAQHSMSLPIRYGLFVDS
jgi:hypothetical protein